jgi:hypothetical protein
MITRREFIRNSTIAAGGIALLGNSLMCARSKKLVEKSTVVSAAAEDMLIGQKYNAEAVHRAFSAGLKEMTSENTLENAWSSLFSPDDVVGIKINCLGAPKISSSLASINEAIVGLKSAGVKENNIIIWDRMDREFKGTGLKINKGSEGVQVRGTSTQWEGVVPWIEGYDKDVYLSMEDGTLKKFRELVNKNFVENGTHRDIFNSLTWLWMLIQQGNEKAQKHRNEIRRLYMDYSDREGIKKIAEQVANEFNDVTIENEEKSCFSEIVTKDITKLVNIAVLKHNEDSGITWALKNIALGVTTNKVRFHIDFCTRSIAEILSFSCLKDKMVLHIGEAAKISTVSVLGSQLAFDNRIFFSTDPVAMDRIGLDILEQKRKEQKLDSIRDISTHIAACAEKGLGIDDVNRIDWRELKV